MNSIFLRRFLIRLLFNSFLSFLFTFYFWPMYSLNMFMTHSKWILRLVSGYRKFHYSAHIFEQKGWTRVSSIPFFAFIYHLNLFQLWRRIERVIEEWTFLFLFPYSFFCNCTRKNINRIVVRIAISPVHTNIDFKIRQLFS